MSAPVPKKVRKNKKQRVRKNKQVKKNRKPDALSRIMSPGQRMRDVRNAVASPGVIALSSTNEAITEEVPLQIAALSGIAMSYVSAALQRGFMGIADSPQVPYDAFCYMVQILSSYVQNGTSMATTLPYWFLCLCQALSPKTVNFVQGKVAYKFILDNTTYVPLSQIPIGYPLYSYMWLVQGPSDSNYVNGFPVAVAPSSYSPEDGPTSFNTLVQFMAQNSDPTMNFLTKLVPIGVTTRYASDSSAFAIVGQQEGYGLSGVGGFVYQIQNECIPKNPLFSSLVLAGAFDTTASRFYNVLQCGSGDSIFLGGAMSTMYKERDWMSTNYPKFHAIDFLEFADVVAQWLAAVVQAYYSDPETITSTVEALQAAKNGVAVRAIDPVACPLSLQEMQLILRNTMMNAFKETQFMVQALYPRLPESGQDNQFVPFVSSSNTCPIQSLDMHLPIGVIENIRALTGRKIDEAGGVQWYIPVLGQYASDVLNTSDYYATDPTNGVPTAVFSEIANFEERKQDAKGKLVAKRMPETTISFVDGNSSAGYAFINSPENLKNLCQIWNNWLATNTLQQYSMSLGQMGAELGIGVLTSVAMTRHWVYQSLNERVETRQTHVDLRMEKNRRVFDTVYSSRLAIADTSQSKILSAPYETVLNTWILPVNYSNSGSTISDQSLVQRWQAIMREPYLAATTSGQDGQLVSVMHANYAAKMTKAREAAGNDWQKFFDTMSVQGRGGVLSSLAAGFLGQAFGPAVGAIASGVADVLPI